MTVTEQGRDVLARTLWGEARGEGLAGMVAVAWTIRNRVDDATDVEAAALKAWKKYRVALSRVPDQAGYPGNIDWPAAPA